MFLLGEKVKNICDYIGNLENKNLGDSVSIKKHLKIGQSKHNPSSVKE